MWLAAAIASLTAAGAFGGGTAWPSTRVAPQVALVLATPTEAGVQLYPQGTACPEAPGASAAATAPTASRARVIAFRFGFKTGKGYADSAERCSWTKRTTVAPSPTAVAQRLIEPARTSPAA